MRPTVTKNTLKKKDINDQVLFVKMMFLALFCGEYYCWPMKRSFKGPKMLPVFPAIPLIRHSPQLAPPTRNSEGRPLCDLTTGGDPSHALVSDHSCSQALTLSPLRPRLMFVKKKNNQTHFPCFLLKNRNFQTLNLKTFLWQRCSSSSFFFYYFYTI